jgi:hypothetical protein
MHGLRRHTKSKYDDPAISFFQNFRLVRDNFNMRQTEFTKARVDCDMPCGFFLSVLWRASISSRRECQVSLGPDEGVVGEVLFGLKSFSGLPGFDVIMQRYRSKVTDPTRIYGLPEELPASGYRTFGMQIAGFRVVIKLDPRPFPHADQPYTLRGKSVLRGQVIDYDQTLEFRHAVQMVHEAERRNKANRSPRK